MSAPLFEVTPETTVRLRVELPLTADEMAAALYYEPQLVADDLVHDQDVRDALVLAVATEGLVAIRQRVSQLHDDIATGTVDAGWLAVCRRRLADVFAARPAGRPMQETRRAIARRVAAQPGITPKRLADALGISHEAVRSACARMAAAGQVSRDAAGRYFPATVRPAHAVLGVA
ncbi:winged helix-turn-helix transcriptional regulator [Actinocatenispora sera]|uniref:Uncharacterized protein n=1 Tax=Actinocatenispora sera TaxID=390989 RepID=A0A810KZC7_9ACTN|nr:winged helix-turn-helix transcriptional regulator [Actinocatenispora sera]BCJ28287.1 hypothetical protein Asera_23950 [Actinocatenispora sera]